MPRYQAISLGPIALSFRGERIAHWPEHRNVVAKSLRKRLAEKEIAALEPQRFAKSSVAIQGLPALERLLFHEKSLDRYAAKDETARFRCQLTLAIAINLKMLFQKVIVLKLEKVLGPELTKAKPKLAENYRSGHSVRNIVLNLESAYAMYNGEGGFAEFIHSAEKNSEALDKKLRSVFKTAISSVQKLPSIIDAVADPTQRIHLEQTLEKIKDLRDPLLKEIPKAANAKLGFNELDGD